MSSNDTTPEAERVWANVFRSMSAAKKWRLLGQSFQTAKILHFADARRLSARATTLEIQRDWTKRQFGLDCPCGEPEMAGDASNLRVLREFVTVIDRLGIVYSLGGSMASSLFGIARFTQDADVTVEPFPGLEQPFVDSFGLDYYVSLAAVKDAHRGRSSFNLINTREGFKIDVFLRVDKPFEISAMARRVSLTLPDDVNQPIVVYAPEDVILFKLRWYRLGQETSDQQWKDILGVMSAQQGKLDEAYIRRWATEIGVEDLWERAQQVSI